MSRVKPWPTVANRHRVESIFKAGEVVKQAGEARDLIPELRQAISDCNIPLALAIANAIEGRVMFVQEAAKTIGSTLEAAPSSNGSAGDG